MANTPNLDLVKPAGTDKALVSVINSNSDKIDAGFGSLSDQIETLNGKLEYKQLLTSAETTETLYTVTNMANMKEIVILLIYSNRVFASEVIPIDAFKSGYKHTVVCYTPNFEFYAYATYVSDTSIKSYVVGTSVSMNVYGR